MTPGGKPIYFILYCNFFERRVGDILKYSLPKLKEKPAESLHAVLPIVAVVLILCFSFAPVSPSVLLCFLVGAVMIVVGIMFFTLWGC